MQALNEAVAKFLLTNGIPPPSSAHQQLELEFKKELTKNEFEAIVNTLKTSKHQSESHTSEVGVVGSNGHVRRRVVVDLDNPDAHPHIVTKRVIWTGTVTESIRATVAMEEISPLPQPPPPTTSHRRTKKRVSFWFPDSCVYRIDLTQVHTETGDRDDESGGVTTYELEVELLETDAVFTEPLDYLLSMGKHRIHEISRLGLSQ